MISLVSVVNGDTRADTIAFMDAIHVDAGLGGDIIRVNQADGMVANPAQSLPVWVEGGGGNAGDRLIVNDDGLGDLVVVREAFDGSSGTITVGPLAPIAYDGIEKTTITPLDPITGGTGSDALGRLFVFKPDEFELNDARQVSTHLGIAPLFVTDLSITPGTVALPAPLGNVPGDEDWYEFMPEKTGTYRFDVLFQQITTLTNGRAGLPNNGNLDIAVYDQQGNFLAQGNSVADNESVAISMLADRSYFLRVVGAQDAINVYDLNIVEVDLFGPVIDSVNITGQVYDLFDPKPSVDGPTPPVTSLTIAVTDPPPRAPGDLYPALELAIAQHPGHYLLVGDHNGPIPMGNVVVINDPPVVGLPATATIQLVFFEPLPDDRYTLWISASLTDPAENQLDGETNAVQPLELPQFPTGDGVSGGEFVARFTVDSRPEIGVTASTRIYVDINGNLTYDPAGDGDTTNKDLIFRFGVESDAYFAGNFAPAAAAQASGFDKLGAFGVDPLTGQYRFLLDFDHNGVPDFFSPATGLSTSGLPVAGDFAPAHPGDEIGLFMGDRWHLDTNGDNIIDVNVDTTILTTMRGIPAVGDVNGDGIDDLITFDPGQDVYFLDLNSDGVADDTIAFGIPDFIERPVTGDLNLDGVDDLGFWVAGSSDKIGEGKAEWHFLISDRIAQNPNELASALFDPYSPDPLGNDQFANFGDRYSLPIFGNFDPPVAGGSGSSGGRLLSYQNAALPSDVNADGHVSPIDVLIVIDRLNRMGSVVIPASMVEYDVPAPYWDVSGDGVISPIDVLTVISVLNHVGEGEGEHGVDGAGTSSSATAAYPLAASSANSIGVAPLESEGAEPVHADSVHADSTARWATSASDDPIHGVGNAWLVGDEQPVASSWERWEEDDDLEDLLAILGEDVSSEWSNRL